MAQAIPVLNAHQVANADDKAGVPKHFSGHETFKHPEKIRHCTTNEWQERCLSEDEKTCAGAILCKLSER